MPGRDRNNTAHPLADLRAHVRYGVASPGVLPRSRGRSAVGSASPCQGEGRGFESRRPLERPVGFFWWSGREARQRTANPCTRVQIPSPPRKSTQQRGRLAQGLERYLDTVEVTGSIPVSPTTPLAVSLSSPGQTPLKQRTSRNAPASLLVTRPSTSPPPPEVKVADETGTAPPTNQRHAPLDHQRRVTPSTPRRT